MKTHKTEAENYDAAHEADMRALMREQLRADISPEEANEEMAERDAMLGDVDYDPEQYDFEDNWEEDHE